MPKALPHPISAIHKLINHRWYTIVTMSNGKNHRLVATPNRWVEIYVKVVADEYERHGYAVTCRPNLGHIGADEHHLEVHAA